jgi:hypothetical protein
MTNSELFGHDQILHWFNYNALNGVMTCLTLSHKDFFLCFNAREIQLFCRRIKT